MQQMDVMEGKNITIIDCQIQHLNVNTKCRIINCKIEHFTMSNVDGCEVEDNSISNIIILSCLNTMI